MIKLGIVGSFDISGNSSSNPLHYAASSVGTSGEKITRYAIFKPEYYYVYKVPCQVKIAGKGLISNDNTKWYEENIILEPDKEKITDLSYEINSNLSTLSKVNVSNNSFDLCPRYMARYVSDIKIAPSPLWLKRRLS